MSMAEASDIVQKVVFAFLGAVGAGAAGWFGATARVGARLEKLELRVTRDLDDLSRALGKLEKRLQDSHDELRKSVASVDEEVDDVRDSSHNLARHADLARFMSEVNDRWTHISRVIGHIEGLLETRTKRSKKDSDTDP
jgi:hypothetical protein